MNKLSFARSWGGPLLCLSLGVMLAGACATEANTLEPEEPSGGGKSAASGAGGKSATSGSGGKTGAFGGSSAGKATDNGGEPGMGGMPPEENGGEGPAPMAGSGGSSTPTDKCQTDAQCTQVEGSCFVCEDTGTIKDCVDKGPPECGNATLDACEVCEEDDEKDCTELGTPGEFSGGKATCNSACDGWDTSSCSICGNDTKEDGEDCDGADPAVPPECDAESENPGTPTPCTSACVFDTTVCNGCSDGIDAADCLDGTNCTGASCNDAECKIGTECGINCSGGGVSCAGAQCNHEATCDFGCTSSGHCNGVVCDSDSTCTLDCHGGGSTCDGTVCRTGALCAFNCSESGSCKNVDCAPGAECDFNCNGGGSQCSGEATCSDGMTCDFACSNSGNCGALEVTCEAGSVCNFTCTAGGSVCPKADCKEGADCTFDCSNSGNCNAPTCANGACTGNP